MAINPATGLEDPNYVDPNASMGVATTDPNFMGPPTDPNLMGPQPMPVPDVAATGATTSPQFSMDQLTLPNVGATNTAAPATSSSSGSSMPQILGVGATLAGGALNAQAIKDAASQLQSGLKDAQGTISTYSKPYVDTGAAANKQLAAGLQAGGQFNKPFSMADATNSDAERYARATGIDALQNSALAKGGLLGTNSLVGLEDFAAKNAAQYQNQAFNQWLQQNAQTLGGLENLSGTGSQVASSAGGNIANLQSQGAQAGMNATLGAANQYNQAVANAIAAYKALAPTGTTTGGGTPAASTAPKASVSTGTPTAAVTTPTGTASGVPAGAVTTPAGTPVTNTPAQVAGGVTRPSQMIDPAQSAQINQQNFVGPPEPTMGTPNQGPQPQAPATAVTPEQAAAAAQSGAGPASPMNNGPTSNATPAAVNAAAAPVAPGGAGPANPMQQDPATRQQAAQASVSTGAAPTAPVQTPQEVQTLAQLTGTIPTGNTGTGVGDLAPLTGALIVQDPLTGLPIDSSIGFPTLNISGFDAFFNVANPTPFDNTTDPLAGLFDTTAAVVDPFAEFANLPTTLFDNTTDPLAFLNNMPAIDVPVVDPNFMGPMPAFDVPAFTTPTFDMSSFNMPTTPFDPYAGDPLAFLNLP